MASIILYSVIMHFNQRTIKKPVNCTGIGLHSGKKVNLAIKPAPVNHGIIFTRTDLLNCPGITAHFNQVVDTSLATVIGSGGCIVSTIEHLMASFAGLSIDNALVEPFYHLYAHALFYKLQKPCFGSYNSGYSINTYLFAFTNKNLC